MRLVFPAIALAMVGLQVHAAGQNFPGDTLAQGEQFVSTSFSMSDWHYAADFVSDATIDTIDDTERGYENASNKGYDFQTKITYLIGITSDITAGIRTGYAYQKDEASIDASAGAELEGDWVSEGGTDLTLIGKYRLDESTSADVELQLPVCSANDLSDVCSSKFAIPENSQQEGRSGGQGDGYYQLRGALSSHWLTETDSHWMGSLFASATLSDDVFGQKASAPFSYGAMFGGVFPLKQNHQWIGAITLNRMLSYSAYSVQAQTEVDYSDQSSLVLSAEYLWDFMSQFQLRPFASLALVQQPTLEFTTNNRARVIEYTTGTKFTMGAELRASF